MEIDDALHLRDLTLPEGVTLLAELDEVVVKVVAPHVVEEPVAPVETQEAEAVPAAEDAKGSSES
jgi:hypothetical protein